MRRVAAQILFHVLEEPELLPELITREAGHEGHVERIVRRKRTGVDVIGDAPPPAELHRPDIHLVHLGRDDAAVALLDELAGDAAPAKLGGERKADRPAADDQYGNSLHSFHGRSASQMVK